MISGLTTLALVIPLLIGIVQAHVFASGNNKRATWYVVRGFIAGATGAAAWLAFGGYFTMTREDLPFWLGISAGWYPVACILAWLHKPRQPRGKK